MPRSADGSIRCVGIDRDLAAAVWPQVADMIAPALPSATERDDVAVRVARGDLRLWLVVDGLAIVAAAVTERYDEDGRRYCGIVACGGSGLARWGHLIERLEQQARDDGCAAMRINGRIGWARVFPAYRIKRVILERTL